MKIIDLAIVIPSLNEEYYIGDLLDSIINQTIYPKEIVVVDAESEDKTIMEIKKRQSKLPQLKYFQIPQYSVARQRNFGVKKTKSLNILFLDADVILKEKGDLETYWEQIVEKKPDIAIATNLPDSDSWKDKLIFKTGDLMIKTIKPFTPAASGVNMYVRRSSFISVGGFDEEIKVAEDFNLVQRMVKKGAKFFIFDNPKIYSSVRRWRKHGRIRFISLLWVSLFLILLVGYKRNPVQNFYKFGKHNLPSN